MNNFMITGPDGTFMIDPSLIVNARNNRSNDMSTITFSEPVKIVEYNKWLFIDYRKAEVVINLLKDTA